MSEDTPITITHGRSQDGWPSQGEWTYADYLSLAAGLQDGRKYELIDGHLFITNPPSTDHQYAVSEIRKYLGSYAHKTKRGHALVSPFQVHLNDESRPLQPDIVFIKADSWPGAKSNYFLGAPDLVIEVLAPGTYRADQAIKFAAYEKAGVPEYWLVNPHTKAVQVFTLYSGIYGLLQQFVGRDVIESRVLSGLNIPTNTVFN